MATDLKEHITWINRTIHEAKNLKNDLRQYINPKDVPETLLVHLKDLLRESKSHKSAINDVISRGKSVSSEDGSIQSHVEDLAILERQWQDLKHLLKALAQDAHAFSGFRSSEVCLYYTSPTTSSPISSPIKERLPIGKERVIQLKSDPNQSLLEKNGRKYFAKLSIPYRVFIKSKVKLRYKGRGDFSQETSLNDSDLSAITECSSLDSSFRSQHSNSSRTTEVIRKLRNRLAKEAQARSSNSLEEINGNKDDKISITTSSSESQPDNLDRSSTPVNLSKDFQDKEEQEDNTMSSTDIAAKLRNSPRSSPKASPKGSPRPLRSGTRASPVNLEEESPISTKRRRLNSDDSYVSDNSAANSNQSSPRDSPIPLGGCVSPIKGGNDISWPEISDKLSTPVSFSSPLVEAKNGEMYPKPEALRGDATSASGGIVGKFPNQADFLRSHGNNGINNNLSFDSLNSSAMSSAVSTPSESPYNSLGRPVRDFRTRYKKDELWASIASDYQYLMGDDIIETCKTTESDLSWESDEGAGSATSTGGSTSQVSFNEFLQQYKELTEWLGTIHTATQIKGSSLSEKYLNQSYHEEMLARSPRRQLFNDYARQLQLRYPSMRDEIQARLQRLNGLWQKLERAICPAPGATDEASMIQDLAEDLQCLQKWLVEVEYKLSTQIFHADWSHDVIREKIQEHKTLQAEIEAHSKIVSAILKLCERLECRDDEHFEPDSEKESLQLLAISLERRWHTIWLQSLEWQCRLEEGLTREQGLFKVRLTDIDFENDDEQNEDKISGNPAEPIATQTDFSPFPTLRKRHSDFGTDPICLDTDEIGIGGGLLDLSATDYETETERKSYYDGNETDTSAYDVIPFSEGEYEKIESEGGAVGTDLEDHIGLLNENRSKTPDTGSVTGHITTSGGETDHGGVDSAFGRSYSDQSVTGSDSKDSDSSVYHSTIRLSSDAQGNTRASKTTDSFTSQHVMEMNSGSRDKLASQRRSPGYKKNKREHDIGYSSESHSNEDLDWKRGRAKSQFGSGLSDNEPNATSSPRMGSKGATKNPLWRHSMTSAYDTCSNGSDPNLLENESSVRSKAGSPDVEPQDSGFASAHCTSTGDETSMSRSTSANQNFYYMTTIDQVDSSSSVDPQSSYSYPNDRCESGNTSDMDSEFPLDEEPYPFCTIPEESASFNEGDPESNTFSSRRRLFQDGGDGVGYGDGVRYQDIDDSLNLADLDKDMLSSAACSLLNIIGNRKDERGDSLSVQIDSEASSRAAALSEDELAVAAEQLSAENDKIPQLAVLKLVKQAELMIREGELSKLTSHKWPRYAEQTDEAEFANRLKVRLNESFTSNDGSIRRGGRRASSCDASDESGSEFSAPIDRNTLLSLREKAAQQKVTKEQAALYGPVKLRHKQVSPPKYNPRPTSVNELGAMSSSGLDLSPFSMSESAIDDRDASRRRHSNKLLNQNMRRATSEQQNPPVKPWQHRSGDGSGSLSPGKRRRRRLRHSASEETARTPTKRSSPGSSWNKLHPGAGGSRGKPQRRSASPVLGTGPHLRIQGSGMANAAAARRAMDYSDSDVDYKAHVAMSGHTTDERHTTTTAPSAVEFSENAWDPYQMPPQDCALDAPEEEKLDASHLQGEWEPSQDELPDMSCDKRILKLPRAGRVLSDSDSDLEEFENMIGESLKALTFTENTLNKRRKDPMETGLILDPSEYNESHATCQTNVRCLNEVVDTLQAGSPGRVTQDDIERVLDIVEKWESMETLAYERHIQSKQLSGMYGDMMSLQASLDEVDHVLGKQDFCDVTDIETTIFAIKQRTRGLEKHRELLKGVGIRVQVFENNNDDVNMNKFMREVDNLERYLDELTQRCEERIDGLQGALLSWYDLQEKSRELEHSLTREKDQMRTLELSHELLVPGHCTAQQIASAQADLKTLEEEFKPLSSKLQLLRALHSDTAPYCSRDTELRMRAELGVHESALSDLKVQHGALVIRMEQAAAVLGQKPQPAVQAEPAERSMLRRILRAALPWTPLLIAVLIVAYLLNPELFDNFGLVFSPQLRYVRGAPPT